MIRESRRTQNSKQDKIQVVKSQPSVNSLREGQEVIYISRSNILERYRKEQGRLWVSQMNTDNNFIVNNNLKVKGSLSSSNLALTGSTVLGVASTVSTATHQDAYDVTGKTIIPVDTSSNDVRFGGFTNGIKGQIIHIVPVVIGNNWILEHVESSGTQKIYLEEEGDVSNNSYGGISLYCDGSNWFQISRNIQ